jgi:hypothetical protein
MHRLVWGLVAALLACAAQQDSRPPAQPGGVVVMLPREQTVAEMSDAEILAGELGGEVTAVSGRQVTITIRSSPCVPRVGDRVELFRVRQGFATPAGEWRVSYAEGDDVRAAAVQVRSPPAKGMSAIVHSAIPSGTLSRIGFENTPRPQLPVPEMVKWTDRHLDLAERAKQSFADGQRYAGASPPDYQRAAGAYRAAADLNHVQAALALFRMWTRADPPLDASEAAKWLRRAAELGDPEAQLGMGEAYEGRLKLLPVDLAKAKAWYRRAGNQGSAAARIRLRQLGK